ncbi:hypothetical protein ACIRU3_26510 [Streptomyces sp. NPDC101151]|uniref:hypothetical protein n=1 Tax=Streptomyces sp. NPDC101151 TaxID=3366115 RepID=UPI0037FF5A81
MEIGIKNGAISCPGGMPSVSESGDWSVGHVVSALLNSGFALIGVMLGAWLTARSGDRQWTHQTQLAACRRLMDEFALLYDSLARTHRAESPDLAWASWNQALTEVSFVCTKPVVDAAYALDETLWRVDWAMRGGQTGQDAWLELRRPVENARAAVVHAVRHQTSRRLHGSVRTLGRPADEDPMWTNPQS